MHDGTRLNRAGDGLGWSRLAEVVATEVPVSEVDGIWVFRPIRNGPREWGTAIVSRLDGERRRIYTARYQLAIKGKERGRFEAAVEEVGSGTVDALEKLVAEAARRTEEEEPPAPVETERWYPREDDPIAADAPRARDDEAPSDDRAGDPPADPPTRQPAEHGPPDA